MRDPGMPAVYTAGNRPDSRDARSVHPTSNLYPQRSMSSFPLFFSRKRKGRAKRKLPADVRKLKNGCELRGKRTRRARSVAAVRQAIQLQVLDRYTSAQTSFSHVRPSPPFFFPLSPIGRTGQRASVIAPDAATQSSRTPTRSSGHSALDAESRNTGRSTCKIHSLYVPFLDPASLCGVTPFVIPHSDVVSRNIRGGESLLLFLLCHELDPASRAG